MAVGTVYVLHGIYNTTLISQITSARPVTDIQTLVAQSAGLPYPLFVANMGQNPAIPFDTTQVKTILDTSGAMTSISDLSGANTDLYFKAVTDLGRRTADASSAHIRFRMSQAFLVLDRITAGHRSEATASCRIGTTYDGSNAPLVPAGGTALVGTPVNAEHFVAGPVSINSSQLFGVEDTTIDFNRQVIELGGDGELYNTFAACQFYAPVITLRCTTHCWATYGITGTALSALSVYLRKVSSTGRVADGTAQHIKFTATTGVVFVDESSGGANDPSMTTVRIVLASSSATTEPITVDTAIAIT